MCVNLMLINIVIAFLIPSVYVLDSHLMFRIIRLISSYAEVYGIYYLDDVKKTIVSNFIQELDVELEIYCVRVKTHYRTLNEK